MPGPKEFTKIQLDKVAKLKTQEEELSALYDDLRDGIILHDLNGDILEANKAALEMLGYDRDEIVECNFKELQPNSKRGSDKSVIALDIFNDSKIDISRTVFVHKYGPRFLADVKTSYVRFENAGSFITVVQRVFRDIETTELRARAVEANAKNIVSPKLNERVSFVNIFSEELTSPLKEMNAALKLLSETKLDEEQKSLLSFGARSGDALLNMIDDVMDFFKIGNELLHVQCYRFNLMAVVGDVIELMTPVAEKKHCEFSSFIESNIPEYVMGDEARVRQVLTKLLYNAIYLTNDGHIKLEINQITDGCIRFEVVDSCSGIMVDDLEHLFTDEPLSKQTISRKYSDVALGYILAKNLVAMMGGEMGFNAHLENGLLFWITLDLKAESQNVEDMAKYKFLKGQQIVCVDCLEESRDQLQRQLESWGATLHAFGDENSAIEFYDSLAIDAVKPSLIILNAHNDDVSYAALIREINEYLHRDDNFSITNFVVITPGIYTPHTARHFARIKHTHVKHPLRIGTFANKLARLLCLDEPYGVEPLQYSNDEARRSVVGTEGEVELEPDLSGRILIVDDGKVTQMATSAILRKRGFTVDCANNGWEAISAIEKLSYDVVLMDVQMPELDGIEATKRIRAMEMHQKHTPILAITANMEDGVWRDCVYAGMDDYMTKPIETQVMISTIQYWMGTNSVSDPFNIIGGRDEDESETESGIIEKPRQESELLRHIKSGEVVNVETILQLEKDTSADITMEMVDIFIQETEVNLNVLEKANNHDEFETIARAAHTMISSSETFGALWLQSLARSLEKEASISCKETCDELVAELPAIFQASREQLEARKRM